MNPRQLIKEKLLTDLTRRAPTDSGLSRCEGQACVQHTCQGGLEMNEVIFTRRHIQHLSPKEKTYFWSEINCSINCQWFHSNFGHTKDFRDWFLHRIIKLFDHQTVAWYIIRAREWVKFTEYSWVTEPWEDKPEPKEIPIKRKSDGKVVAGIVGDILQKRVKSLHMLLNPQGWCYDNFIIEEAKAHSVKTLILNEVDTGTKYTASMADFEKHSLPVSRGHGHQRVLQLRFWEAER